MKEVVEQFKVGTGQNESEMQQPNKYPVVSDKDLKEAGEMFIYLTSCSQSALRYSR